MHQKRNHDYKQLEQEIEQETYRLLLDRLRQENQFYRKNFTAWSDVVAFMREGSSKDPLKDEVLRPILAAHTEDGDSRWRTILLAIFWPGLKSICIQRRRWDDEFEKIWANAVWIFLRAVCRLDLAKRPDRLVQKLINDTGSRLSTEYRRMQKRADIEVATDPALVEMLIGGIDDPGFTELVLRDEEEHVVNLLRKHMEIGRIGETDFHLIVGSRIYGKRLRECAEDAGLSYQAAKKRRQRAEATIRRLENLENL